MWLRPTDICVVTGGTKGLGAEILKELALLGCQTVCLDIDTIAAEAVGSKSKIDIAEGADDAIKSENSKYPAASNEIRSDHLEDQENRTLNSNVPPEIKDNPILQDDETLEMDLKPTLTIQCDVRSQEDLQRARERIFEKFDRYPSVIVLNAGVRRPLYSIAESDFKDLQDTIDVNLSGVLKCIRTFLPDIIANERGTIISIASALGILVPKGLGAYGASKAGIIGLHEALEQEVSEFKDIKVMLVCPGQLDTSMFADVKSPSDFLAPIVPPDQLSKKIVKRIRKGKSSVLYAPTYVRYLQFMHSIPVPLAKLLRKFSGVDKVYDDIVKERMESLKSPEQEAGRGETEDRSQDGSQCGDVLQFEFNSVSSLSKVDCTPSQSDTSVKSNGSCVSRSFSRTVNTC